MQITAPLALYIHIPWCIKKCNYCDFNSYACSLLPEKEYTNALALDLRNELETIATNELTSIYIGGGTPSLFSEQTIANLLNEIAKQTNIATNAEISIEVNPGTIDLKKLQALRSCGINRISIGVQSFQDNKLAALGRIHNAYQAKTTIRNAQTAGFENINLDLIYGLPEQTVSSAMFDLKQAIELNPTHVSWYQLTIEANTYFAQHLPQLPSEETIIDMGLTGESLLQANNFNRYEISAFSRTNYQCKHNLNYWLFGDYIGIGAGAHGKITSDNAIKRNSKIKLPNQYMDSSNNFIDQEMILTTRDIKAEFMINTLRLYDKIPMRLLAERAKLTQASIAPELENAKTQGFIDYDNDYFMSTKHGKQFLNQLLAIFF